MLAPVLRLLAIYICVGLAVFGYFKRDTLKALVWGEGGVEQAVAAPAPAAAAVAPQVAGVPAHDAPAAAAQPQTAPLFAPLPKPGQEVPVGEPVPVNAASAGQDYQTQWNAARQAFWDGDIERAVGLYKGLLAANPQDGPLNGELGNIYYTQNRRDEAAPYFEAAAMAAVQAGNRSEVNMLISVLRSIAPEAVQRVNDAHSARGGG